MTGASGSFRLGVKVRTFFLALDGERWPQASQEPSVLYVYGPKRRGFPRREVLCYLPIGMTKKSTARPSTRLATVLCCAPLILEVARVALEGSATAYSMAVLGLVAFFGLPAYLGQRWALPLAPYIFLAAAVEMVLTIIFNTYALYYWTLVCGLAWCGYELAVSSDLRSYLSEQKGDV